MKNLINKIALNKKAIAIFSVLVASQVSVFAASNTSVEAPMSTTNVVAGFVVLVAAIVVPAFKSSHNKAH